MTPGQPVKLLLVCLLALLCANLIAAEQEPSEADVKRLQQEINQLQSQLQDFKGQQSGLQQALRQSEVAMGKLAREISAIKGQLKRQQDTLDSLEQRRTQLGELKAKQQDYINRQIVIAYQLGRQKKLKLLLNQEDPTRLSRAITYLDYFNRARIQYLKDYADTIAEIDRVEPLILQETDRLAKTQFKLEQQSRALAEEGNKRKQALSTIARAIKSKDQQLKTRKQERQRLEQLLKAVEQAVANLKLPSEYRAFAERRGKMQWPTKGKQGNRFGARKGESDIRWQGIQLYASEGTPVRSIHNGRVVYADWFRGQGMLIIVDHGDGYMSLYGNKSSLLRQTGDWVAAGEPIATVGRSGGLDTASLYFEIRKDGNPQDPRRWCKK